MAEGVESGRVGQAVDVERSWRDCAAISFWSVGCLLLLLLPVERERVAWPKWRGRVPFGEGERGGNKSYRSLSLEESRFVARVIKWSMVNNEKAWVLDMRALQVESHRGASLSLSKWLHRHAKLEMLFALPKMLV